MAQKKIALVIGNASYVKSPLRNPLNDADDVSAKLKTLGFEVILAKDCKTKRDMRTKLDAFCYKAANADAGVFYYSGHGIQLTKAGGNYLIPTEAAMTSEADVQEDCISLLYVLNKMDECGINMKVAIIDACRDNPFRTWQKGGAKGLSTAIAPPAGTFIAFATSANDVAADGTERNSPFTSAFLTALDGDNLEISNVFTEVKSIVKTKTDGGQRPWTSNDLSEYFYFGQKNKNFTGHQNEQQTISGKLKTFTVKGVSFNMIPVEGGTFIMGATAEHGSECPDEEKPTHHVSLSAYYIGQTEVTQALWKAVMGYNPSHFDGDDQPVESISWLDCQLFLSELSKITGKHFRLPTEAEWEYAARGGNQSKGFLYSGSNYPTDVAWYNWIGGLKTKEVARKEPNELGIYDMTGNVCEWCQDWYGSYNNGSHINPTGPSIGTYRVYRGGAWTELPKYCRISERDGLMPNKCLNILGMRLCQDK